MHLEGGGARKVGVGGGMVVRSDSPRPSAAAPRGSRQSWCRAGCQGPANLPQSGSVRMMPVAQRIVCGSSGGVSCHEDDKASVHGAPVLAVTPITTLNM